MTYDIIKHDHPDGLANISDLSKCCEMRNNM